MKAEEFEKEFLALPEMERMEVMRKIMPVFCEDMTRDPEKTQALFFLFMEECGGEMSRMFSTMGMMMGRKGGGCCG